MTNRIEAHFVTMHGTMAGAIHATIFDDLTYELEFEKLDYEIRTRSLDGIDVVIHNEFIDWEDPIVDMSIAVNFESMSTEEALMFIITVHTVLVIASELACVTMIPLEEVQNGRPTEHS